MGWLLAGSERSQKLAPPAAPDAQSMSSSHSLISISGSSYGNNNSNSSSNMYYQSMANHHAANSKKEEDQKQLASRKFSVPEMMRRNSPSPSLSIPDHASIPELQQQQQQQQLVKMQMPTEMQMQKQQTMDVLLHSIHACTSNIFGLYGLEVWKFEKSSGNLINIPIIPPNALDIKRQSSGLYIKRITQEADAKSPNYDSAARDAFERLTDTTRMDYLSKTSTDPGVGVAGTLWSESTLITLAAVQSGVQTLSDKFRRMAPLPTSPQKRVIGNTNGIEEEQTLHDVCWRGIDDLAADPDQPYDERLQLLARAGFGLAAGIPFKILGFKGIVIFFANPHADGRKLRDKTNSQMIKYASNFIGAAASVQRPLQNAQVLQKKRPVTNWRILRAKILTIIAFQRPIRAKRKRGRSRSSSGSWGSQLRRADSFTMGLKKIGSFAMNREESLRFLSEATTKLKSDMRKSVVDIQHISKAKSVKWWTKIQGGHASVPPSFNINQCMWTFAGVYSTHTILEKLDTVLATKTPYTLVIGPLGALTTLQYNLTAAPASQPRNAFFAQVIALSTCYFLHQFERLDKFHRCTLAPAIVSTITARLGLIHPPAGATAVVFSINYHEVEDMLLFLVGVLIAISAAVAINNMSDKRQYPSTRWMMCQ